MALRSQLVDLDFAKVAAILNAIIHKIPNANLATVLTADGQIGYDSTNKYPVYFDATTVQKILSGKDIATDFSAPSNSTVPSTQAVVTYVASLIASGVNLRGDLTKTGSYTPPIAFPVATAGSYPTSGLTQTGNGSGAANAIKKGDAWYLTGLASNEDTTIGATNSKTVTNGALLVAKVDTATNNGNDWIVLEQVTQDATETIQGIMRIATQVETDAGTLDNVAVTPLKLANAKPVTVNGGFARRYKQSSISLVANTAFNVVHNLGTSQPNVRPYDSSGNEIGILVIVVDANTVSLTSNAALSGVSVVVVG